MAAPLAPLMALAWRESRTARRRLLLYMSSISLGVAALVALDSFSENVTRSVHEQSRALLGGDVAVRGRNPFNARANALLDSLAGAGVRVARQTTFPSMAFVPRSGGTRLVQIRAVSEGYPFYGDITSSPPNAWSELHAGTNAVVDPSLLASLDARVGDTLSLGTSQFVISGTLGKVPGELGITAAIGPRVYISDSKLGGTGLLVFGSRAQYEAVLALPRAMNLRAFVNRFGRRFRADSLRVDNSSANENRLSEAVDQLHDFLSIIGLVALLLGGIGVASGVHAFVMRKIDTVAVLRCLGATSRQVLLIYVTQAAAMGLIGALVGAGLGIIVQFGLPRVLSDFLPLDVELTLEPAAVGLGLAIGTWVALVFALRPLVALRRVSPLQALRRETDADVARRSRRDTMTGIVSFAIVASVVALSLSRAETMTRGLAYSGAIAGAIAALWVAALTLSRLARMLIRPGIPFPIRQGIAALYRPGNQTRAVVLALGFGVFLIATINQVQRNLLRGLDMRLEQARGNIVFFDVQQDQRTGLDSLIRSSGHSIVETTPVVRMRIDSVNALPVDARSRDGVRRSSWATRREYNSTYRDSLTAGERIVSGQWFTHGDDATSLPEISMELDVANELRLTLGDTVTWNIQGVRVRTRLTSLREVKWASFQPNFFVVFEPRAIIEAPTQFVILANVASPDAMGRLQRDAVMRYPTISSLDLTLVQKTVLDVVGKVTMAIRFLAMLSLGLAVPVLFSAVSATRRQRLREGVLLKTLGATRRQIGRVLLAEYALLGALGALAGLVLSVGASWALTKWVFNTTYVPSLMPMLAVGAGMIALSVAIGLLTGREVFRETAMAALREA